jgi:hypothetical protein
MKKSALTLAAVAVILLGSYGLFFGAEAPCDAFRVRIAEAMKAEPPDVQKSAAHAADGMSSVACTAGAVRLAAGDRSFIRVVDPNR